MKSAHIGYYTPQATTHSNILAIGIRFTDDEVDTSMDRTSSYTRSPSQIVYKCVFDIATILMQIGKLLLQYSCFE